MMMGFPSLYQGTAPKMPACPPLSGSQRASVVIVGAGLTGCSTALALAEAGTDVAVLEAAQPGAGASGRNGGQVNPGWKLSPAAIEAAYDPDRAARLIDFGYSAPDRLFSLVQRLGIDCGARQNGTFRAATDTKGLAAAETLFNDCARRGMPVQLLSREEMAAHTGTDRYAGGLLDPRGGDIDPFLLVRGLARAAQNAGARIFGTSAARSITRHGSGWRVSTGSGHIDADRILIATNGYTDDLWPGLRRSLVPVFGAVVASAPLGPDLARRVFPARGALYETGHITVYYRVDSMNRLIIGGRGPMHDLRSPAELCHITGHARRLWPALAGIEWAHSWNGRLGMTKDTWPHLCELAPGVWSCLAYNGRGVALSTAIGPRLAALMQGQEHDIELPITPLRRIGFHAFWPLGVAFYIAMGRLRDRFGL